MADNPVPSIGAKVCGQCIHWQRNEHKKETFDSSPDGSCMAPLPIWNQHLGQICDSTNQQANICRCFYVEKKHLAD